MTNWALLLLIMYVSLGLSKHISSPKAIRAAVVMTTIVVSFEMVRMGAMR